jgi:hypothetical protein
MRADNFRLAIAVQRDLCGRKRSKALGERCAKTGPCRSKLRTARSTPQRHSGPKRGIGAKTPFVHAPQADTGAPDARWPR